LKLLAIDTSTLACSVGACAGARLATRHEERDREHTKLLLPMIRAVLDETGIQAGDVDAVVLGNGPGSFIGLRIAAAVAEGIAFAAGLGIVPVSSLAAVALQAGRPGELVAVAQDAHMNEVYLGLYRIGAGGLPVLVAPERLQAPAPISELGAVTVAAGAGWLRYPALLEANRDRIARMSDEQYPRAEALLRLGAQAFRDGGAIAPEAVVPTYLRHEVARRPDGVLP
jgi:tRNA threonylcarbamoyladenosine biosynthesis protein TsaB